jgi:hypothetical protein
VIVTGQLVVVKIGTLRQNNELCVGIGRVRAGMNTEFFWRKILLNAKDYVLAALTVMFTVL